MDDADLEAGGGEGVADDVMNTHRLALNDHDQIDDPMLDRGSPTCSKAASSAGSTCSTSVGPIKTFP